uniref:MH2 domain-containing protein n=1 Tax=Parascaris univalens TaxID=6257 RepID=A0A915B2E9_PARUN
MAAFCRTALIERLLHADENSAQQQLSMFGSSRCWTDIETFEKDNIAEVNRKLANIEEQIWGKIIVMERNVRTAKAYLRSRIIAIDGSYAEFDGLRIGVSRFANVYRDERTMRALRRFNKGVKMKIDDSGGIWIRSVEGSVMARGMLGDALVCADPIKVNKLVFDLKLFRDIASRQNDFDELNKNRLNHLAIIYIMIDEVDDPLKCPLWFAVVHLIAIEMVQILLSTTSGSETASSSASADSQIRCDEISFLTSAALAEKSNALSNDSCTSSSHYTTSNSPYSSNRQPRGGAFKRINRADQFVHPPTRCARLRDDLAVNLPLKFSVVASDASRELGRSLIDLSELAYLRNPAYFRVERETRGGRGHNRTRGITPPPAPRHRNISNDWRSKSETSLYCERL